MIENASFDLMIEGCRFSSDRGSGNLELNPQGMRLEKGNRTNPLHNAMLKRS